MKKLVLLLAVAFSATMFSCGSGDAEKAVDSDSIKAAQAKADSIAKANAGNQTQEVNDSNAQK